MITPEQARLYVQDALERDGWAASDATGGYRRGQDELFVDANRHWLSLAAPLPPPGMAPLSPRDALRLSERWYMVKIARDDDGRMALRLELPLPALDRLYCRLAAEAMSVFLARIGGAPAAPAGLVAGNRASADSDFVSQQTIIRLAQGVVGDHWMLRDRLGPDCWKLQWKYVDRVYDVYLTLNRVWACFQLPIPMPAVTQAPAAARRALYDYLLRLNEAMYWARFGLDDAGQVLLSLEMPLNQLTPRNFRWATRALARYAADFVTEVQVVGRLADDPRLWSWFAGQTVEGRDGQ